MSRSCVGRAEFQLELVGYRYPVRSTLWDRRLEVTTCLGNRVAVEGGDLHAPALVEPERTKVVVGRDQPEPRATCVPGGVADGIEERSSNAAPSCRLRIVTSSHSSSRTAYEASPARWPSKSAIKPGSAVGSTSSPSRATTGYDQLSASTWAAQALSLLVSGQLAITISVILASRWPKLADRTIWEHFFVGGPKRRHIESAVV